MQDRDANAPPSPPGQDPQEDAMKREEATEWLARIVLFNDYNLRNPESKRRLTVHRRDVSDALNNIVQGSHIPQMASGFVCWCGAKHHSIENLGTT